jgi:hypothetical protein
MKDVCPGVDISCPEASKPIHLLYIPSWFQTGIGNVVSKGGITSAIPATPIDPYFIRKPLGESAGISSLGPVWDLVICR